MSSIFGFDAETSSPVDLRLHGADAYTRHPETRCLMLAFKLIGSVERPRLWTEGDPFPYELYEHVVSGGLLSGWNVIGFDRLVYERILVPRHGFPPIDSDAWKDSMHLAAAANLPRSLDGCAKAVGVEHQADLKDSNRIRRVTDAKRTPIPAPVAEILDNPDRFDKKLVEDLQWLADRCVQDVAMEEGVLVRLPAWPDTHPWRYMPAIDRRINDRGVMIDLPLVHGLANAAALETARLDVELAQITKDAVPRITNIESLKKWLIGRGVELPKSEDKNRDQSRDTQSIALGDDGHDLDDEDEARGSTASPWRLRKNDIADLLARDDLPDDCRAALYIRIEAAKASARKLKSMLNYMGDDSRMHGLLQLFGAQATGRWSSGGPQIHNMVRDAFAKDYENIARQNGLDFKKDKARVKQIAAQALYTAIQAGRSGDPDLIRSLYETERTDLQGRKRIEGVLPWVSRMMRRTICAPAGSLLLNGDFANIQARLPVWIAGQEETVQAFARGEDLYRVQASPIYGIPPEELSSEQRQIGKVMRLFLGFGAGVNAFIPACMIYGIVISHDNATRSVSIFRETNKPLVDFWDYNLNCAIAAVQYPGREFPVPPKYMIAWFMQGDCLCMRLPSGRIMRYWQPRLTQGYWSDGTPKRNLELTVLVMKGGKAVLRRSLWRGLAMQNLICAMEADIMGCALANMDAAGIPVVLHVHDNAAAEAREEEAERLLPAFKQCMLDMPAWTAGLPVAVDADASARFG